MIEMSSGIGATAMGIGVSHGAESNEGGGCRLRQSMTQASSTSQPSQHTGNTQTQQQTSQQLQQASQQEQQQQQRQSGMGLAGRSKKDNCCLCWCCCCSCSRNKCLAGVGSGNGGGTGTGSEQGSRKGGDAGGGGGLTGDLLTDSAGNGLDGLDGLDVAIECCNLEEVRAWGTSFDQLMRSPAGRKLFREFLVREWSAENIAFWLACEQLKHESDPEKIEENARFIYENYISILSPKEVSLDSRVREIVNRNMVEPTPHTFDEAQLQIYTLMHRDSYPRFVNSELYRKVARLSSDPPSPTNDDQQQQQLEQPNTVSTGKTKSKRSTTKSLS
ncbi:regulator of G-protein signaling 17 isoform X3 [Venturia canescens]|uniref:regulator of G-protein signaling 17 isoform X3 n=1 Tax=Venturia canescens TaxID=32260 RepID=UPI001C9CB914|nr:regulator of G-protein signaling 17 isoform X3 [Venturia canescens]